jgi:hypothetical protein
MQGGYLARLVVRGNGDTSSRDIGERFLTCGDYRVVSSLSMMARKSVSTPANERGRGCSRRCMRSIRWCVPDADGRMKCSLADAKLPAVRRSRTAVIAVIQDPVEIRDILTHLVKTGRTPCQDS